MMRDIVCNLMSQDSRYPIIVLADRQNIRENKHFAPEHSVSKITTT